MEGLRAPSSQTTPYPKWASGARLHLPTYCIPPQCAKPAAVAILWSCFGDKAILNRSANTWRPTRYKWRPPSLIANKLLILKTSAEMCCRSEARVQMTKNPRVGSANGVAVSMATTPATRMFHVARHNYSFCGTKYYNFKIPLWNSTQNI